MNEKSLLKNISIVEASVKKENEKKNQRELVETKYYSEFAIKSQNEPIILKNVFITIEKNKKGKMSYHFRWIIDRENGEQTIDENLVIDENGEIYTTEGLKNYLDNAEIDIEKLINENDVEKNGTLRITSKEAKPQEIKKELEGKENQDKSKKQQEQELNEEKEEQSQDEETQKVEQDLKEQGEDLGITNYKKIKDSKVHERMPEVFGNGAENEGLAFSNKLNRFVIISKEDGHYKLNENVEPARMTWKTITSIDENGENVERKVPHALMEIPNNPEKEIAVTLDQYGYADIQTVDVLPCQERVARQVRLEGEDQNEQESKETSDMIKSEGKMFTDEIAHKKKELEEVYEVKETQIEELRDLDIEAIMEVEAKKAQVSKEGFKQYVKNADGKTLQEKIENAHEDIEQEYRGNSRPR